MPNTVVRTGIKKDGKMGDERRKKKKTKKKIASRAKRKPNAMIPTIPTQRGRKDAIFQHTGQHKKRNSLRLRLSTKAKLLSRSTEGIKKRGSEKGGGTGKSHKKGTTGISPIGWKGNENQVWTIKGKVKRKRRGGSMVGVGGTVKKTAIRRSVAWKGGQRKKNVGPRGGQKRKKLI